MKLLYIAGPIYDPDPNQVQANIDYACQVAAKYWQKGYSVICPHANTRTVERYCKSMTAEDWLQGDFEQLERCDAIVLIKGWEKSKGSKRELEIAVNKGLEVIVDREESECIEDKESNSLEDDLFKNPIKDDSLQETIMNKAFEYFQRDQDKKRTDEISKQLSTLMSEDDNPEHQDIIIAVILIFREVVNLYERLNEQTQKSN